MSVMNVIVLALLSLLLALPALLSEHLKDFVLGEPDPLIDGVPKKDNPFAKSSRGCTIL